ncbi:MULTISPECIES: YwmB family TATA-box binding protein [Bacillaceae]|uniref:YwmB family TATA-box binding protein n=1 Tax=Bacillales TaxID=1385 RepID=UPI001883A5FF|nr:MULTISPECIES: YwmB family TATA-box binding protein [Bacillaceae]MBF0705268.1 YwmB family TATA-box binding protein [Pseudalkalibacillus hwajinpoensis]MDO6658296.1 YwmB family TATA-box binding protein [Anaerobacillus sp. 1_MG-2023]
MKLLIGVLSILLLASFSNGTSVSIEDDTEVKVTEMANVLLTHNYSIEGWSLYTREKVSFIQESLGYKGITSKLTERAPGFSWGDLVKNDGNVKVSGTRIDSKLGTKETLTLVSYPENNRISSYLIYKMEITGFSQEEWRTTYERFKAQKTQLYPQETPVFTCFVGEKNDTMNIVLYNEADKLLGAFSASKVEEINEETFVSLSAYHEEWEEDLVTNNKRMNIQIALRNTGIGGGITATIGTPIITTEY